MSPNSYFDCRVHCPACGSTVSTEMANVPYSDGSLQEYLTSFYSNQGRIELEYLQGVPYVLKECNKCTLVYQQYIPNEFIMQKLYEVWIDPQVAREESRRHTLDYFLPRAMEISNLIRFFNSYPAYLKVLDFGMGWAEWLLIAKSFGCEAWGMELSAERLTNARLAGIHIMEWEKVQDALFDYIHTEQVFEHIPQPLETLKHLVQGLRVGGVIKISVPNGNKVKKKLRYMDWSAPKYSRYSLNAVAPLEHINCYTSKSIIFMAKLCGLKLISVPAKYYSLHSIEDFLKNKLRPFYYKIVQGGSTSLYFQKI